MASGFVDTGYIPGDNCGKLQDLALELCDSSQIGQEHSEPGPAAIFAARTFFFSGKRVQLTKYIPTSTTMKAIPFWARDSLSVLSFTSSASFGTRAPRTIISITVRMG